METRINRVGGVECVACGTPTHRHPTECDPTAVLSELVRARIALGQARRHRADHIATDVLDIVRAFMSEREWAVVDRNLAVIEW